MIEEKEYLPVKDYVSVLKDTYSIPPPFPESPMIYLQISKIMNDLNAIGKKEQNKEQNFSFRGIDTVYNELHQWLAKHNVFTVPEVISFDRSQAAAKSGRLMNYTIAKIRFRFYAEDGSFVEAVTLGEAADTGDKSSNKAMAIAHKYALLQVFCIPTEEAKDPDEEAHEIADGSQHVSSESW